MSKSRIVAREKRVRAEAWGEKSQFHCKERWILGKEGRPRKEHNHRSRRKHKRVSGCKNPQGEPGKSWFHFNPGQT